MKAAYGSLRFLSLDHALQERRRARFLAGFRLNHDNENLVIWNDPKWNGDRSLGCFQDQVAIPQSPVGQIVPEDGSSEKLSDVQIDPHAHLDRDPIWQQSDRTKLGFAGAPVGLFLGQQMKGAEILNSGSQVLVRGKGM